MFIRSNIVSLHAVILSDIHNSYIDLSNDSIRVMSNITGCTLKSYFATCSLCKKDKNPNITLRCGLVVSENNMS